MPKKLPNDLRERVDNLLHQHPDGLTIADLESALTGSVSRRTLQRRLVYWTRIQAIRAAGVLRGRRYFSVATPDKQKVIIPGVSEVPMVGRVPNVQVSIQLSTAAIEVQAVAQRPIADRLPVGYQRAFLEDYVPNESAYLTDALRSHLNELGRTADRQRPAGTYAREILGRLLVDLSWSSSRLEGNTYSLLDTKELVERGVAAQGKDAKETQMILNHKAAIELLVDSADEIGVNRYTLTNLHALLADNLLEDPRNAGRLRQTPVAIGATTYLPTAIPQLIEEMFTRLLGIGAAIRDPFEQSFFLLVHIPYLQPFVDVNKRTSRLASNIPLISPHHVPLSFVDVPENVYVDGLIGIYEQNRIELMRDVFLWAYERSARQYKTVRDSLPEPDPFRLRYRNALINVIGHIVRRNLQPSDAVIAEIAKMLVAKEDLDAFKRLVISEVGGLHEGNIARYRLRLSEFQRWRS